MQNAVGMNRRPQGFTLIEAMVVVAIVGILAALSFSYLRPLSPRAKLSGAARVLSAQLSAGKSQAYGRSFRVAILINTDSADSRFSHWMVVDPWSTLDESMANDANWTGPADLLPVAPAPEGSSYRILDSETLPATVNLPALVSGGTAALTGFRGPVARGAYSGTAVAKYPQCPAAGFFPPPFCNVPVGGCTFCTNGRGAIFFEPDGGVRLINHQGQENGLRGSISLAEATIDDVRSVVLTSAGLVRAF